MSIHGCHQNTSFVSRKYSNNLCKYLNPDFGVCCHPYNLRLSLKVQNTTKAEFANTVDPDETAHKEPSYLDLHCLPSCPLIFNLIQFELKAFQNFPEVILPSAFLRFTS